MRNSLGRIVKISSIALMTILLLCSMCFGAVFVGAKHQSASVSSAPQQTQTNEFAEQLFERIYLNNQSNSDVYASNIYGTTTFGSNNMKLVDFDISKLGDEGMDYVVVVAFVNLYGSSIKWQQTDIDNIMQSLNDDDPNNNVYSVREYFKEQTYGKLRFKAGYVEYDTNYEYPYDDFYAKSTDTDVNGAYTMEAGAYAQALNAKSHCYIDGQEVTVFHCRLLYYPYESTGRDESAGRGNLLWPHAWPGSALVTSPRVIVNGTRKDESPFVGTYAHEFTHILGVSDLYCDSSYSIDPVGKWYLMASTDYNHPQSINAYFKLRFGLTGVSPYGYQDTSKVRVITSSGEYSLAPANSQTGTIAFKFAERDIQVSGTCGINSCPQHGKVNAAFTEDGKEMFFVEYKKKSTNQLETDYSIPSSGLIIYRVVESAHTKEFGNLYPNMLGDVKFQVYVLRANGISGTEGSAVGVGSTFGSVSPNPDINKVITYFDGTNTQIAITNNGYDSDGNAKVQFTFAEGKDRYSASGTLKVDGKVVDGAQVMVATPSSEGGYNTEIDSKVKTDENGYFFVDNLVNGSKISFLKDGKTFATTLTIDKANIFNQAISERTIFDVTLRFWANESNVEVPLQGVEVTNADSLEHVGTSNADGAVEIQMKLSDRFSFSLAGYNFSDWTFTDSTKTEQKIQGSVKITTNKVQVKVVNSNGTALQAEFSDVTADGSALYAEAGTDETYIIQAKLGAKIRVFVEGYAPKVFVVEESDYTSVRKVVLYVYQSTTVRIYNAKSEAISNVTVQVDGETIGTTDLAGERLIDNIYIGQTISFSHNLYKIAEYVFDGKSTITLQAEYKSVKVLLQFYKPKSFINENIVPVENVSTNLTIVVNSMSASISVYDNKLCFDAFFYSTVYFNSPLYAITNKNGEFLMEGTSGIPLVIDPTTAVKIDDVEGYVTYYLFAKKYITLTGTVTFPKDAKTQKVEIFMGGKRVAESDDLGNFTLEHVVEGDEIVFKCDGYTFTPYYVVDTSEPMTIVANPKDPFEYLAIYILFGVLVLCFIIPYFVGLRRKRNPLVDIDKIQYDNLEGKSQDAKNGKKNKKTKK